MCTSVSIAPFNQIKVPRHLYHHQCPAVKYKISMGNSVWWLISVNIYINVTGGQNVKFVVLQYYNHFTLYIYTQTSKYYYALYTDNIIIQL